MKKGFCIFSLLILLLTPFSISAEEIPSLWSSRPQANNLSVTAQQRYCSTVYPNLSDYDFVAYFTVEHSWLEANTLLYGTATYSSTSWTFNGMAWNDSDNEPVEITINRGFSWDDNADYIYKFLDYEDYDNTSVLNVCADLPTVDPTVPPSLVLPSVNVPNIESNSTQHSYIQTISSPSSKGGYINAVVIEYYNIYSVVQTAETDQFFDNINDNYYIYQSKAGKYIYPVYDHSVLTVYAPNMSVASVPFSISSVDIGGTSFSFPFASGIIQRDVNRFDYSYVDLNERNDYDFSNLPFDNASDNQNHIEFLGTTSESYFVGSSSSSVNITVNNNMVNINFFFVVTDKYDTIQIATNLNNQTILDNNMTDGFINLDNVLQHGNTTSQAAQNSNNQMNNNLNNTLDNFESIENQYNQNITDNLNQIDLNFNSNKFGSNFLSSAQWFTTQFNNIVLDTPFNGFIIFSCVVGLGLLLLGRFL